MSDGVLTPEWKAWAELAGEEVVRYMRSGQMKLVPMSAAHRAVRARPVAIMTDHLDERQLSEHQRQVIAGVELGLSDSVIAKNLILTPPAVKRMRGRLKRLGFL